MSDDTKYLTANPRHVLKEGRYRIFVPANSGKALDVNAYSKEPNTQIQQYDYNGGTNQIFILHELDNGWYSIESESSHLWLDIAGGSKKSGKPLIQWYPHGKDNQQFRIDHLGGDTFSIISKVSGLAITVSNHSKKLVQKEFFFDVKFIIK